MMWQKRRATVRYGITIFQSRVEVMRINYDKIWANNRITSTWLHHEQNKWQNWTIWFFLLLCTLFSSVQRTSIRHTVTVLSMTESVNSYFSSFILIFFKSIDDLIHVFQLNAHTSWRFSFRTLWIECRCRRRHVTSIGSCACHTCDCIFIFWMHK